LINEVYLFYCFKNFYFSFLCLFEFSQPFMFTGVGLNDRLYEDVQRYSDVKHYVDVRKCSAGKESGATLLKISQYGSYKCTTLGHLFATLKD
jgi:hypothetical protein